MRRCSFRFAVIQFLSSVTVAPYSLNHKECAR
jgi:hypothetical protein